MSDSQLPVSGNRKELIANILSHLDDEAKANPVAYIASDTGDALSYYWCSVLVEESAADASDDVVRQGLEKALQGADRLDFHSSPQEFLDAVLRFARQHIKYKQWTDARNLLSLADQLDEKPPGWVSNYLAKLLYETDPEFAYEHPEQVLDKLVDGFSQPNFRQHAVNVLREFLESAREAFEDCAAADDAVALKRFKEKVQSYLSKKSARVLRDQTVEAALTAPGILSKPAEELTPDRLDVDFRPQAEAREYISQLESQVSDLIARVSDLESTVDELATENIRLYSELEQITEAYTKAGEDVDETGRRESPIAIERLKVLVLGAIQVKKKDIFGILKRLGVEKRNIHFVGYDEAKTLKIDSWQYNCPYDGILIGPVPHSSSGTGSYSSLVERLKNEEGFPPTMEARTDAGGLKITKSSFRSSMTKLLDKIGAMDPELAGV
jgi:hypothetical protein